MNVEISRRRISRFYGLLLQGGLDGDDRRSAVAEVREVLRGLDSGQILVFNLVQRGTCWRHNEWVKKAILLCKHDFLIGKNPNFSVFNLPRLFSG